MPYTITELLHNFRRDQDDEVEPYLWADDEFFEYLDEAQDEFCELVDALATDITVPYVAANVVANNGYIDISQYRITKVRSADTVSNRRYLTLANQEEFDENPQQFIAPDYGLDIVNSHWKDQTGDPYVLITDYMQDMWKLYPLPVSDDSISARVFHKPLTVPIEGDKELEITNNQHVRAIMLKTRSLAYLKQDAETYDKYQAAELEQRFLQRCEEFDKRVKRARRRTLVTSYGGIPQS